MSKHFRYHAVGTLTLLGQMYVHIPENESVKCPDLHFGEPGQVPITDGPYLVFIIMLNRITWGPSVMGTWLSYPF